MTQGTTERRKEYFTFSGHTSIATCRAKQLQCCGPDAQRSIIAASLRQGQLEEASQLSHSDGTATAMATPERFFRRSEAEESRIGSRIAVAAAAELS
ncbi:unnamed protein product [Soboliphyme baturini]|uniref:Uncharacterized protein n=1 Tax=Soboliphyme baturini TaxID=241478 RepID=A0A183IVY5_9BILA|nr:unnamed protein product [Soboliphyme baturini]